MDQKNRRLDSAFVTATLMFGCAVALVCEGMPPESDDWDDLQPTHLFHGTGGRWVVAWAVCITLALACIVWSMVSLSLAMNRFATCINFMHGARYFQLAGICARGYFWIPRLLA
jgi:hypothetical protein